MKTEKCSLPADSNLREYLPVDYTDSFSVVSDEELTASSEDMMVSFWTDMPGWVNALFAVRNAAVRLVGLRGDKGSLQKLENCIRNGGTDRLVTVVKHEGEDVMIMKDKHLDAYISVKIYYKRKVYINTLVKYHNNLGRVYFLVIRPFHGIIVRQMLKRAVRRIVNGKI